MIGNGNLRRDIFAQFDGIWEKNWRLWCVAITQIYNKALIHSLVTFSMLIHLLVSSPSLGTPSKVRDIVWSQGREMWEYGSGRWGNGENRGLKKWWRCMWWHASRVSGSSRQLLVTCMSWSLWIVQTVEHWGQKRWWWQSRSIHSKR